MCGLPKAATFDSAVVGEGGDLLGTGEGADTDALSQEEQVWSLRSPTCTHTLTSRMHPLDI